MSKFPYEHGCIDTACCPLSCVRIVGGAVRIVGRAVGIVGGAVGLSGLWAGLSGCRAVGLSGSRLTGLTGLDSRRTSSLSGFLLILLSGTVGPVGTCRLDNCRLSGDCRGPVVIDCRARVERAEAQNTHCASLSTTLPFGTVPLGIGLFTA